MGKNNCYTSFKLIKNFVYLFQYFRSMIFVIRHGERADDGIQNEVVPLDFDHPLTQKGIKQA